MEENRLTAQRSVLVVDRSEETREVLKTALERRGFRILAASRIRQGRELAQEHHPDVIVLDLEVADSPPEDICSYFQKTTEADQSSLVVLGSIRRAQRDSVSAEIISKPYHYAPLVRKIEELLSAHGSVTPARR
ncbi:MAG: two-component system response regulator [Thermoguttaceae bacterium]|jgi:DNA-binding response OmpR family regulator